MAITIRDNEFYNLDKDTPMGVHAKQSRAGRWQFRMSDAKGKMVASGMAPAEFARTFWLRDDFEEANEER